MAESRVARRAFQVLVTSPSRTSSSLFPTSTMVRQSPASAPFSSAARSLRVVASGTLFLTHTLALPSHPEPGSSARAHSYTRTRNGSACTVLAMLAQLRMRGVERCWLVASLGGNEDGREVVRDLEGAGVSTKYCKIWDGVGVPGAWVLNAANTDTQTVINHNPLPDITHEEFVSLLGPLLAPENYPPPSLDPPSPPAVSPRPSLSLPSQAQQDARDINGPPFEWLHFEGRSVRTTLHNMIGVDGLARERKWRSQCVFSVDIGRRAKQGVEALIPHADVLFLNKHYAQAHSPAYASTPRAFLLSLTALAPPHALLVAYWGTDGAAALSVPTREYFQSSGWVEPRPSPSSTPSLPLSPSPAKASGHSPRESKTEELVSVRSGSDFWAAPGRTSSTMSAFSAGLGHGLGSGSGSGGTVSGGTISATGHGRIGSQDTGVSERRGGGMHMRGARRGTLMRREDTVEEDEDEESDADSEGTEIAESSGHSHSHAHNHTPNRLASPREREHKPAAPVTPAVVDEVGAQDAFVAGMIYALSRRLLPGAPYSPGLADHERPPGEDDRRWKLDECLRFATELAGRKARKRGWDGLSEEMARAGWFEM